MVSDGAITATSSVRQLRYSGNCYQPSNMCFGHDSFPFGGQIQKDVVLCEYHMGLVGKFQSMKLHKLEKILKLKESEKINKEVTQVGIGNRLEYKYIELHDKEYHIYIAALKHDNEFWKKHCVEIFKNPSKFT